ncbi:D-alanyl-D-alanine carboxypeptidase/D-alanyl-D-alanine-endopeptidase [Nocardioides sp. KIGAM211]|uniref:D-alanyl-D-alanine carboxypeptidase/D-alanyl-D-alanine-endopeptidase n=1 Tax=Nocardioides luti TaxID=2761101 RepID=A0A7X0RHI6_9ACTN|nr:D-alanyl-D-alanine carboxypeptidase/D-alanyl-D-alanine-endopeptidase [Nocardioides luti]
MSRRDTRHASARGGRFLRWFPVVLVLAVLAAAAATYRFDLGERWLGLGAPDPSTDPAAVAPPPGLDLPALAAPRAVAVAAPITPLDPARVRRAVDAALGDADLGRHVLALVAPLDGGEPLLTRGSGVAVPASTTKLLTTTAALSALGPGHTFRTSVVAAGRGRIVLVGGGDPFLGSKPAGATAYPHRADVVTLARATAAALEKQGTTTVRLGYDDSLFSGPTFNPHWPADYGPDDVVSPITALWVDEGRQAGTFDRVPDPSLTAATVFAGALARNGVNVLGVPKPRRAPTDAVEVAGVDSAPLSQIVEEILAVSDNEAAEVLGHHVGLATGGEGSFADGAAGVQRALEALGVTFDGARLYDGSGLSRQDRLTPATLAGVLEVAADPDHPELRAVVTGLPVAGFTGSLTDRFATGDPEGRGRVRAKTGTLRGVTALAGVATDRDGHPMVFVLMADRIDPLEATDARDALDRVAATLGACRCA